MCTLLNQNTLLQLTRSNSLITTAFKHCDVQFNVTRHFVMSIAITDCAEDTAARLNPRDAKRLRQRPRFGRLLLARYNALVTGQNPVL
jgi:hypothetical protein